MCHARLARAVGLTAVIAHLLIVGATPAVGADTPKFTLAGSIYAGWMPWYYANESGLLAEWAEREGVEIEFAPMEYMPSVAAYAAGQVDACAMTNMDALSVSAEAGVDSTALIVGDYSNGNDAILTRHGVGLSELTSRSIFLSQQSVSRYLFDRALTMYGLRETEYRIVDVSGGAIAAAYMAEPSAGAVVTWNPMVRHILNQAPDNDIIFDSSQIPGEILDLVAIRTHLLATDSGKRFASALTGAWYQALRRMQRRGPGATDAIARMAEAAQVSVDEFNAQLRTTAMFYTPHEAVAYILGREAARKMDYVRHFCYAHGLLGVSAESADAVGILLADGTTLGDPSNILLRFDTGYARGADPTAAP